MYDSFKLNNGLKVIIENMDNYNSVSVGLWVKNGSRNESSGEWGISHFIEHMMFKGTKNRTSKQIVEAIENVGGQINAFTGKEATCYYVKLLDTHIQLGLEIICDMIFNSKFDEEDIEKEKSVIIEEINMDEDSPDDVLLGLHEKAMWGEDSLSRPILGYESTVKAFTREKIIDYIDREYYPENCVLSICGNVDMKTIYRVIDEYFGGWKNKSNHRYSYSNPEFKNNIYFRKKNIEQIHLSLGIKGIPIGSDNNPTAVLLANILGGGASSILFQKIREELALCYSVYVYMSPYVNCGSINIGASLSPNNIMEAIEAINGELIDFCKKGITQERLERSKEQLKGSYILGLESTSSRMFGNGKSLLFKEKVESPKEIIDKIDLINMNKVEEIMDLTFRNGITNSAYVGTDIGLLKKFYNNRIIEITKFDEQ